MVKTTTEPIDLLLCDINIPGMDGLAFLRHLALQGTTSSVILCSALDPPIIRVAGIMAKTYGIELLGVVEKPLSRQKLDPLLRRHLNRKRVTSRPPVDAISLDEVREGLARAEFEPHFQPKVLIESGRLVGVEALLRWHHRDRGLVAPADFIPVMESSGLITSVTFMMIEAALAQSRRWRDSGFDIPVAVNISVASLSDTSLPDRLEALILANGLSAHALTLEITETVAMTDFGQSMETLARCRMKGIHLAIDNYGTGFSSMQQLTRLPLSELKIDQIFVTGAGKDPILETLIGTTVAMADRLGLRTVAEGVETKGDWDVVATLGCGVAQGNFIARPMPADRILAWYEAWCRAGRAVEIDT
jgi:EAL domain-containing protein (putative c-di-GMP-specific phosphodiesterase class I)